MADFDPEILRQIPHGPSSILGVPEDRCAPYRLVVAAGLAHEIRPNVFQRPAFLTNLQKAEARLAFMCADGRAMNCLSGRYWVGNSEVRFPDAESKEKAIDLAIASVSRKSD